MPPHCDSLDGPVVTAAARALAAGRVEVVLPFVPADGEPEVREAFEETLLAREPGGPAGDVADRWFFETVVRVHRAGEGAPYTGIKPAGLDVGPVIPVAERSLETGSPDELVEVLSGRLADEVRARHGRAIVLKGRTNGDIAANREYVEAMLGLQVWAHSIYEAIRSRPHEAGHPHEH